MNTDKDLILKIRRTSEKIAENLHIVANDPSMAFYRIQEHVRKVLPPIIEKRAEVINLQQNLQGHCYDVEYAICVVADIEKANASFRNIEEMLKTSIFLKQQLKYEGTRDKNKDSSRNSNSVYKRFSAHITLDLSELPDISGVMRETSNRMENMISRSSTTNSIELQRSHTTLH